MHVRLVVLTALVAAFSSGCFLLLKAPEPGAPCETEGDCDDGERCLANVCVVDERPQLGQSCENRCGQELDGCFCDVQCLQNWDCCADFAPQCGGSDDSAQCAGRCGEPAPAGCFCDPACVESQDCCPDYVDACVDLDGGVVLDSGPLTDAGLDAGLDAGPSPDGGAAVTVDFPLTDYISIDVDGNVVTPWPVEDTPPHLRIGPPGGGRIAVNFATGGTFTVTVMANGELGAGIAPHVEFRVDGALQFEHDVAATGFAPYSGTISVDAGVRNIDVVFINDAFVAVGDDRNLLLGPLSLRGALAIAPPDDAGTTAEVDGGVVDSGAPDVDAGNPGGGNGVPIIVGVGWQGVRMLSID